MKKYGVDIKWLAVSCFEMKFGDVTVVTDPYITECKGTDLDYTAVEKCDIICLSHAHFDHITDIPRLTEKFENVKLLCGENTMYPISEWLNFNPALIYPMYPDTELDFGEVKIRAIYGRHANQAHATDKPGINDQEERVRTKYPELADPQVAKMHRLGSLEYRNYLFTMPNGTKVLFFGNDALPELTEICKKHKPDIAIIQRAGAKFAKDKAVFAKEIGCKVYIPHHHDFLGVDSPEICENLKKAYLEIVPDGVFITPKHGEWINL